MSNWYDEREAEYNASRINPEYQREAERVPTILDVVRKKWGEWNPPEGPNTPSFLDTWVKNSPNDPNTWENIKQAFGAGRPMRSNLDEGKLPSMMDDIQGSAGPLLSRIAAMMRGGQEPTQMAAPPQRMQPAEMPPIQRGEPSAAPAINFLTPPPQITNMDGLREAMADKYASKRPGYPLNNIDPYASDPFRYYTERLMR